uniref:Uncharacterized protein n=1 Tax=Chromera velia CCMP2878 TaxID=1169474 RepID=A0A0G4HI67_9ALVE|eukprot:Cvel_27808.t1-p1 / transcript=Cvel_27808.t1 / gene=Cvel_27808 / organism=Chromera_velia_CCMP2878 / gene_product=hypothetical protein / transcript_product=hypothetical protein / location=Cvel_scaffold3530:4261-8679(-) / protein_length=532 / sequence_SO=supercontig / SO=protein_coding / is_pseudo=false
MSISIHLGSSSSSSGGGVVKLEQLVSGGAISAAPVTDSEKAQKKEEDLFSSLVWFNPHEKNEHTVKLFGEEGWQGLDMKLTFRQGQLDWIAEIPKDSQGNHKVNFRLWSNNHARKAQTFLSSIIYSLHWMWKQQWYAGLLYAAEKSGFLQMQCDFDTLATAGVEGPDLLIHLRRMYLVPEVNHKESIKKKFKGLKRGGASNLLEAMQVYQRVLTEVNNAHYLKFPDEEQCTSTFQQITTSAGLLFWSCTTAQRDRLCDSWLLLPQSKYEDAKGREGVAETRDVQECMEEGLEELELQGERVVLSDECDEVEEPFSAPGEPPAEAEAEAPAALIEPCSLKGIIAQKQDGAFFPARVLREASVNRQLLVSRFSFDKEGKLNYESMCEVKPEEVMKRFEISPDLSLSPESLQQLSSNLALEVEDLVVEGADEVKIRAGDGVRDEMQSEAAESSEWSDKDSIFGKDALAPPDSPVDLGLEEAEEIDSNSEDDEVGGEPTGAFAALRGQIHEEADRAAAVLGISRIRQSVRKSGRIV